MRTTITIKNRYTGAVIYSCEVGQPSGMAMRYALESAVRSGADLRGADLRGADLSGADLRGAGLSRADLSRADLRDADLFGADLRGADLRGADLSGADLRDADLRGANLRGAGLRGAGLSRADDNRLTLTGDRPFLSIGPIGSEHGDLNAYLTDYGVYVRRGCFFGSIDEFRAAVDRKHGGGDHAREYRAAIALIEAHAAIWSPATGGQS